MRFNTRNDLPCTLITNIIILVSLLLLGFGIYDRAGGGKAAFVSLAILIPLIFVTWGLHPQFYEVTRAAIRIKRPFKSIYIPLDEVTLVKPLEKGETGVLLRSFGVGGLFGYFGLFTSSKLGGLELWCTNTTDLVLIQYGKKKVVISPEEPGRFVAEVILRKSEL
ncbi:PH domain-containing protein [Chitinophaga defluvii]|uniref:PH domain-containing protein n=1 Tax=Chitinophaga defluvii TaxID=3163343 RepID=A0ABV2T357_9BACT